MPFKRKYFPMFPNANTFRKLKYENYKWVEFCQFVQCQGINRDTKSSL